MQRILTLVVTKQWFDLIQSKQKTEDFREVKHYWIKRLKNDDFSPKEFDLVKIVNGYWKDRPTIIAKWTGTRITRKDEKTDLGIGAFFAIWIGDFLQE